MTIQFTWLALPRFADHIAGMPRESDEKKPEARERNVAVRLVVPAPDADEEPIEPSSPPCYLREFTEDAPERHELR